MAVSVTVAITSAVVVLAMVAGAVVLAVSGRDVGFIVGLLVPVGTAAGAVIATLGKLVSLERKTDEQTETLQTIEHQTNGHLRVVVAEEVSKALDARWPRS